MAFENGWSMLPFKFFGDKNDEEYNDFKKCPYCRFNLRVWAKMDTKIQPGNQNGAMNSDKSERAYFEKVLKDNRIFLKSERAKKLAATLPSIYTYQILAPEFGKEVSCASLIRGSDITTTTECNSAAALLVKKKPKKKTIVLPEGWRWQRAKSMGRIYDYMLYKNGLAKKACENLQQVRRYFDDRFSINIFVYKWTSDLQSDNSGEYPSGCYLDDAIGDVTNIYVNSGRTVSDCELELPCLCKIEESAAEKEMRAARLI